MPPLTVVAPPKESVAVRASVPLPPKSVKLPVPVSWSLMVVVFAGDAAFVALAMRLTVPTTLSTGAPAVNEVWLKSM